ncbi:hypothetical protein N0Y54_36750 [Nostoc punctiforme UO1]|uniref:hypothetical protein n=1 Tax=Nostoc punctiforme TaxID=272131 RepID=UPI0030B4EB94
MAQTQPPTPRPRKTLHRQPDPTAAPDRIPAVTPKELPASQAPTNPPNSRRAEIPGNSRRASDRTLQDNPVRDISRSAMIPKVDMQ